MKQKLTDRVKTWWNKQSDEDRGWYKGAIAGGIAATIGCLTAAKRVLNRTTNDIVTFAESECRHAYHVGLKDGENKAYRDIVMGDPVKSFKKMGFKDNEIKQF